VHGDFSPGNLRVTPDGGRITGIVDWENSSSVDLPMLDLLQLILSSRVERERCELGDVLGKLLNVSGLAAHEARLLDRAQSCLGGEALEFRDLLLLTWVRHVADNLTRSSDLNRHRWWVKKNVESVLARL
jgi:aminoglycoside phosphotransferase (APT) family kinase protein